MTIFVLIFSPLCSRSLVPNITKSKNFVKITIFLLWNSQKITYGTVLLHVHCTISFKVMSQRLHNDNIVVKQGCSSIQKKNDNFHSRNMVIFRHFFDLMMFWTRNLEHNGDNLKKNIIPINHYWAQWRKFQPKN
jgi:hypothetical protein